MARYNNTAKSTSKTTNLAGGQAYIVDPKFELVSILLTSMMQDTFYRSANDTNLAIKQLLPKVGYEFAAKAALYARNEFGMRTVTHAVAGEIAEHVKNKLWTKKFFLEAFRRPDDMLEIAAYYGLHYGKDGNLTPAFPNSLKKAIRAKLEKLSDYQLAKYRGEGRRVKMVDLVNLTCPKTTPAIDALVKGTLKNTTTWESQLSSAGQQGETEEEVLELKGAAWKDLLTKNKLGYLALMRNCRNIISQAPSEIPLLCKALVNEEVLLGEKTTVFPFQIATAIEQITDRKVTEALSDAMDISLKNVPKFEGKTLVVVDTSGSMQGKAIQIASLFAAALYKSNDADLMQFSNDAVYMKMNSRDSTWGITEKIRREAFGGGTNFPAIFKKINTKEKYARVIILSDMQGWIGGSTPVADFNKYCTTVGHRPFVHSFDLNGYGTLQFPEKTTFLLAGFSNQVFNLMGKLETDRDVLIKTIEKRKF